MKDKNGIEIKCENCVLECYQESAMRKMCDKNFNVLFEPNRDALEARIEELQSRKPRAKRLTWVEDDNKCSRAKLSDSWYLKISLGISEADIYLVKKDKDTDKILHSTSVVYIPNNVNWGDINAFEKPKIKVQEWLDNLVAECAEIAKESEAQNGNS